MRANNREEFRQAARRLAHLLDRPDLQMKNASSSREALVEEYIPGVEFAVEGILIDGELKVLAIFDKPDPLEGPFFEETIYVTPSRLPADVQDAIRQTTARACTALGLREGPVHAELRVNDTGAFIIEVAARSIGGLFFRPLRFGAGVALGGGIPRHAPGAPPRRDDRRAARRGPGPGEPKARRFSPPARLPRRCRGVIAITIARPDLARIRLRAALHDALVFRPRAARRAGLATDAGGPVGNRLRRRSHRRQQHHQRRSDHLEHDAPPGG